MWKKIAVVYIIMLLICNIHITHAEEKSIQGLVISPPDNWYFSVVSDNTAVLYDDTGWNAIQIYSVPFVSIIPQAQRTYIETVWEMFDEYAQIEIIKLSLDLTYENTKSEIRTVNEKPIIYAYIDSSQIESISYNMSIVMMMMEDNIVGIAGTNILTQEGESICMEAISWIHPAKESALLSSNASCSDVTISSNNSLLSITLDENEYNIITTANASESISIQRTNIPASNWDLYMSLSNLEMLISPVGKDPTEYAINVRIKEDKYPEIGNAAKLSALEAHLWMEGLVAGFNVNEYESYETAQALYCVFDCKIVSHEKRYATIYDDDMVYIWLSSPNPITEDDEIFLKKIVDQFVYK